MESFKLVRLEDGRDGNNEKKRQPEVNDLERRHRSPREFVEVDKVIS